MKKLQVRATITHGSELVFDKLKTVLVEKDPEWDGYFRARLLKDAEKSVRTRDESMVSAALMCLLLDTEDENEQ